MADERTPALRFRPLRREERLEPSSARGAVAWERMAAVGLLLLIAAGLGINPEAVGQTLWGCRTALLAERANALAGRPAEAAEAWLRVAEARPSDRAHLAAATAQAVFALVAADQHDRAREVLEDLQRRGGWEEGNPRLCAFLGRALLATGRPQDALRVLDSGLRRGDPNGDGDYQVRSALAAAYEALDAPVAAEQLYLGLTDAYPREPSVWNNLAYHYAERDVNLELAERYARRALAMEARAAWFGFRWWSSAHRLDHASFLDTLAWVLYRQDRLDEAEALLRESLALMQPNPPAEVLYHLAQIHYDRGQDSAALPLVQQALARDPDYAPAVRLRELLLGRRPEAHT